MKKYYSGLQIILILVLLSATVYSLVAHKNETDFNAKLQWVEVTVKEKFCDAERLIKRKGRPSGVSSILVSYHKKDYWIDHYNRKECNEINDKIKLYYHPEEDAFFKKETSNKDKVFLFAILALFSLTPLNLLSTKMDQKSRKKKKK
jgi:hypothetical protein